MAPAEHLRCAGRGFPSPSCGVSLFLVSRMLPTHTFYVGCYEQDNVDFVVVPSAKMCVHTVYRLFTQGALCAPRFALFATFTVQSKTVWFVGTLNVLFWCAVNVRLKNFRVPPAHTFLFLLPGMPGSLSE